MLEVDIRLPNGRSGVARIIYEPDNPNIFRFYFPFARTLIEQLKTGIPSGYRTWNRENKVWRIDSKYEEFCMTLINNFYNIPSTPKIIEKQNLIRKIYS